MIINWKQQWANEHERAFNIAKRARPIALHDDTGRVAGVLPSSLDLVKMLPEQLKGSVEDKCLVLDTQTSRTVVMKAGDAIGLDPYQFILMEPVAFASLGHQRLAEIDQGHVDQSKLSRLKHAVMRLVFRRA